jgi:aryl-alcohol dehydrogenase-like predicted oxidoreductase
VEYRQLGNSGLKVSVAGLGTNNFGGRCDAAQTKAVINRAVDLGVNFIDTADVYGGSRSEEYIGKAIKGHRRDLVVATKFQAKMGDGPFWSGASRRYIMDAVEASLKRLDVDYIDLYQVHFWDDTTPIEETMRALDDLIHRGDVRYVGCSNFTSWQIVESQWVAKTDHLSPFISAQNRWNLLDRKVEAEVVPASQKYGLGIVPYSPLAGGFLTGKYRQGQPPPEGTRFAGGGRTGNAAARTFTDEGFVQLARIEAFAEEHDHTVGELALAWLGSQPAVGSVIAGATKPEQVDENVRALEWRLTPEELKQLDETLGGPSADGRRRA